MKRTIRATALTLVALGGLTGLGCMSTCRPGVEARYNNAVDPCWPERYSYQAREAVLNPFEQQANNAHVLDQTLWNYHFDAGTAKLNAMGREKLDHIARRRGCPDGKLFLATARDLGYDEKNPDKLPADRAKLDIERSQAVLAYLGTQPTAGRLSFDITPIDAIDPSMNSQGPASAVRGLPAQYSSTLRGSVGTSPTGAGGGIAPGAPTSNVSVNNGPGAGSGGGTSGGSSGGAPSGGTGSGTGSSPR